MTLMRFRRDVQVSGRYFPTGTVLKVMVLGDSAIVPPSIDARTSLCRVPLASLEAVAVFRATVLSVVWGVEGECELVGVDEQDARSRFMAAAPDCEVLHLEKLEG